MTMTWENYKLIESAQITKTSIKIIQNQRTFACQCIELHAAAFREQRKIQQVRQHTEQTSSWELRTWQKCPGFPGNGASLRLELTRPRSWIGSELISFMRCLFRLWLVWRHCFSTKNCFALFKNGCTCARPSLSHPFLIKYVVYRNENENGN